MKQRAISILLFASSMSLGACATTRGIDNGSMLSMQTETGETVAMVRGEPLAMPSAMQCEPGGQHRADLVCNMTPTDHLYASALGFDLPPDFGPSIADAPRRVDQCDATTQNSTFSCMDGTVASDED